MPGDSGEVRLGPDVAGQVVLTGASTVVPCAAITANSWLRLQRVYLASPAALTGHIGLGALVHGVSFEIRSTSINDNGTVFWHHTEPTT